MHPVAKRYALALLKYAEEQHQNEQLDEVLKELRTFLEIYQTTAELREVLANPLFLAVRETIVKAVLAKLSLRPLTRGLVQVLLRQQRLAILADILVNLQQRVDELLARRRLKIISALPLSREQLDQVAKVFLGENIKKIVVQVEIEPAILGGFICELGDVVIDLSLLNKLQRFFQQFLS